MEFLEPLPGSPHQPVLYQQTLESLQPASPGRYVDGTLGAGGHARGILTASAPQGQLLGLDLDPNAIEIARRATAEFGDRIIIRHGSYSDLAQHLQAIGWDHIDGMLMDLGVSSMQLDNADRGFSFLKEAPLDMRFDEGQTTSAADIVNHAGQKELADILRSYGEEPRANAIADAIVRNRPFESTTQLASLVLAVYKGQRGRSHPATRTFQALRLATNSELEKLSLGLEQAVAALNSGGRLAVISFHSLEDRIVKQYFQQETRDCICPPEQVICTCGHKASVRAITKGAVAPSKEEVAQNPRSRSAKLRVVEKI
ncbi:MAG: rRNA (cytosine1402-N4)-methyltransferase [Chloroflexota bacterium]|nr:rRNA (cytosine1402-N4)-methyltransferase [Chloroflexota bacterium]